MEHEQLESLIAAILTAGTVGRDAEPAVVSALFVKVREEIRRSGAIVKQSATFVPKGR